MQLQRVTAVDGHGIDTAAEDTAVDTLIAVDGYGTDTAPEDTSVGTPSEHVKSVSNEATYIWMYSLALSPKDLEDLKVGSLDIILRHLSIPRKQLHWWFWIG